MKHVRMMSIGWLAGLLCVAQAWAIEEPALSIVQELTQEQPKSFLKPRIIERSLSNGVQCLFIEDHLLPTVQLKFLSPDGSIHVPDDLPMLNTALTYMMQAGGAAQRSPEEVEQLLDRYALEVGFSSSYESASVSLRSMSKHIQVGVDLMVDMMYAPRFDADRFAVMKQQLLEMVRRRNDNPEGIGARVFRKMLYGKHNPWARTPTETQIAALTTQHLQQYHIGWFAPQTMRCAASGDFRADELVALLERSMQRYALPQPRALKPVAALPEPKPGIFVIDRDVPQSVINMGQRALDRFDQDKYALFVANSVYGGAGSFSTWLKQQIRVEAGLAYETWSSLRYGPRSAPGSFQAHTKTQAPETGRVVGMMQDLMADLRAGDKITQEKVDEVKQGFLERMIFQYEDPFSVVSSAMQYLFYGLPQNYLDVYIEKVRNVKLEEVRAAAKERLQPESMTTLIVGDLDTIRASFDDPAQVQEFALDDW